MICLSAKIVVSTLVCCVVCFDCAEAFGQLDRSLRWPKIETIEVAKTIEIAKAIEVAQEPFAFSSMHYYLPFEVQRRLLRFKGEHYRFGPTMYSYTLKPEDRDEWLSLLFDKQADEIARMCAAVYLFDQPMDAKSYLSQKLESNVLEIRLNAAVALVAASKMHDDGSANGELAEFMCQLFVESSWTSFEEMGLNERKMGYYFLAVVASHLASQQEEGQIPALLVIAEREQEFRGTAIGCLRHYNSPAACQKMVELIESGQYDSAGIASSLAEKGFVDAVPTIAALLGTDLETNSTTKNWANIVGLEQSMILSALLKLNDQRAVPEIKKFIEENEFPEQVAQAKRVVIHLTDKDPVITILSLIDPNDLSRETPTAIAELSSYADPRTLEKLDLCVRTSGNFWTRFWAIRAIHSVPGDESSLMLARFFDVDFPDDLATPGEPPKEREPGSLKSSLRIQLESCLKKRTGQFFASDVKRWTKWIKENPAK